MKTSTHWMTHHLRQKALLACAATLINIGIVEYGITFTLTQWISWLFFTAIFLAALVFFPKFIRPKKITSKTMRTLAAPLLFIVTLFICWRLGLNLLQTAAYVVSAAILILGLEFHDLSKASHPTADTTTNEAQTEQH